MIRLNRILIPTDFSPLAAHALRYACDLAGTYRAELHVLHVVTSPCDVPIAADTGAGLGISGMVLLETAKDAADQAANRLKMHVSAECAALPLAPITAVRSGVPWEEIVRYADDSSIDLIVIGSHARGVMKRILLGSTSKSVLEHVARPVLMVPVAAVAVASADPTPEHSIPAPNS